jgi:hypothetical protein
MGCLMKKVGRASCVNLFLIWCFLNLHALYPKSVTIFFCAHFWVNKSLRCAGRVIGQPLFLIFCWSDLMLKSDQKNWYKFNRYIGQTPIKNLHIPQSKHFNGEYGGFWSEFDQYTDRTAYQIPFKFSYQKHNRSRSVCLVVQHIRRAAFYASIVAFITEATYKVCSSIELHSLRIQD